MYGSRGAAANWEAKYSSHVITHGFKQSKALPCVLFHPDRGLKRVVHGDDFTLLELDFCNNIIPNDYDIKITRRLGPK